MTIDLTFNRVTDKKVQFNTDLLSPRHSYLYIAKWRWLKWNESEKGLLKIELLIRGRTQLINEGKGAFVGTKWKRAGSGSAGDVCKNSKFFQWAEKACMQNFYIFTQIFTVQATGSFLHHIFKSYVKIFFRQVWHLFIVLTSWMIYTK